MTWAQYIATGNGSLAFRLDIGGLEAQFVGKKDMDAAASFGTQARVVGLKMAGNKIKERCDLARATLDVGGMRPVIVDVENLPTSYLGKVGYPTAQTWLAANATASATSIEVSSTTGFTATNGYIWIDSECISYTGVASSPERFTGCTRGVFNTLAQAHYIADGASLRYPAVTNQPITLDGQRVRLYAYGELDDPAGDGTLIHTGVVSSDPRYDGVSWSIGVDPLTRLLQQKMGSAASTTTEARGIYYPANFPFRMFLFMSATAYLRDSPSTVLISFPTAASDSAFFETNEAFADYVNDKIAASDAAAWETKFRCVSDGPSGWHMEITTDPATPLAGWAEIPISMVGAVGTQNIDALTPEPVSRATGVLVQPFTASTTYVQAQVPGYGSVPRLIFRGDTTPDARPEIAATYAAWPDGRIYTGGATAPPSGTRGIYVSRGGDGARTFWPNPYTVTLGRIDMEVNPRPGTPGTSWIGTVIIEYAVIYVQNGGVRDFIEALYTNAPTDLNLGAGPDLRSTDINTTSFFHGILASTPRFLWNLTFPGVPKHTIGEVIAGECQAAGLFMRLDSTGLITASRLRAAVQSEASVSSVTQILSKSMPRYERSSRGLVNTLVILSTYDPAEDEHTGPRLVVRDVAAFGRAPGAREVTIERYSVPNAWFATITMSGAVDIASRIFGALGGSYAEITIDVPLTYYAVRVGDVVRITATNVPDTDGTIGIADRAGIVVGREHDLTGGVLTLSVIVGDSQIAGYCPSASIATETNTSGNVWDVTLDDTEAPTGTTSSTWFEVGDDIRVWKFDDTTPATQTGEVTAVTGSTVTISLDGAATLGTGTWVLEYDEASAWGTNPDPPFLFLATSAGRVSLPTSLPAWVFAP